MFSTEIDTVRKLAIHRSTGGNIQLSDVLAAGQGLFAHTDFEAEFSVIWDLRDCGVGITLQEILVLDPRIVEYANAARPIGKTAWIASTALGESIIKLLYGHHDWSAEWRTFSTMDAAVAWCASHRAPSGIDTLPPAHANSSSTDRP